jgi:hypothetical protein
MHSSLDEHLYEINYNQKTVSYKVRLTRLGINFHDHSIVQKLFIDFLPKKFDIFF